MFGDLLLFFEALRLEPGPNDLEGVREGSGHDAGDDP